MTRLLAAHVWLHPILLTSGLLLLSWAAGCDDTETAGTLNAGAERLHPMAQYRPESARRNSTLDVRERVKEDDELPSGVLRAVARRLANARTVATRGELEGPAHLVFGQIKDVAVDGTGRIYVLDPRFHEVRVFSPSGAFLTKVGSAGRGPGELANPLSVAVGPDSVLYVGDITRHVHVFRRSADSLNYTRSIALPIAAQDLCFLRDRLYVHGSNPEVKGVIHEVDLTGQIRRSFNVVYDSPSPLLNYQLSLGVLACVEAMGILAFAPSGGISEVQGWSSEGVLLWSTTLDGYRPITITETADGGTRLTVPAEGFHRVQSLTATPEGALLLQIALVTRESRSARDDFARLNTFLLDAGTGRGASWTRPNETLVAMETGGHVTIRQDPVPQFAIWRVEP